MEQSLSSERGLRKGGKAVLPGLLPDVMRKPRKPLTPVELAARQQKAIVCCLFLFSDYIHHEYSNC